MSFDLSAATLRRMWPDAKQSVIDGTVVAWPKVRDHYGFTTMLECSHFWTHVTWECGGGLELRENGHYSADAIMNTFGVGNHSANITRSEAEHLAALARTDGGKALFNRAYGAGNPRMAKILGNTEPNDGWDFRGFGGMNSTGREAAIAIGTALGQDLVGNPDLCNDPGIALWAAAQEYVVSLHCFKFANADDLDGETVRINGGKNGLSGRRALLPRWKAIFAGQSSGAPALDRSPKALQHAMNVLGFGPLNEDGDIGEMSDKAIKAFQASKGLKPDGDAGDKTWAAIVLARGGIR